MSVLRILHNIPITFVFFWWRSRTTRTENSRSTITRTHNLNTKYMNEENVFSQRAPFEFGRASVANLEWLLCGYDPCSIREKTHLPLVSSWYYMQSPNATQDREHDDDHENIATLIEDTRRMSSRTQSKANMNIPEKTHSSWDIYLRSNNSSVFERTISLALQWIYPPHTANRLPPHFDRNVRIRNVKPHHFWIACPVWHTCRNLLRFHSRPPHFRPHYLSFFCLWRIRTLADVQLVMFAYN